MPNDDKFVNKKMMWHLPCIPKNAPLRAKSSRIQNKLYKISDTYLGPTSISNSLTLRPTLTAGHLDYSKYLFTYD